MKIINRIKAGINAIGKAADAVLSPGERLGCFIIPIAAAVVCAIVSFFAKFADTSVYLTGVPTVAAFCILFKRKILYSILCAILVPLIPALAAFLLETLLSFGGRLMCALISAAVAFIFGEICAVWFIGIKLKEQ